MTDNVLANNTVSQNQNITQNESSVTAAPAPKVPRTYSEEEVNGIVGDKKQKAYQKGYETALAELEKKKESQNDAAQQNQNASSSLGGISQLTPDKINELIDKRVQESIQQKENERSGQQFYNQFVSKMAKGKADYSDFEEKVAPLRLDNNPDIAQLANSFENTSDIMYHFGNNPAVMTTIAVMARTVSPQVAYAEMQKISNALKSNQEALKNKPVVNNPLSQIKPSTVGADNGKKTISDLRKQSYLKA